MEKIEKTALIVAPSYPGLPDAQKLPGTSYDLKIMRNLTSKLQFDDVKEIVGDKATKDNIIQALDDFSMKAAPDSIALIYYSGHGYYLPITKDEGLVPADATQEKLVASEIDVCITGRDLLPYLERLSSKRVKLTVIFDCCNSGQLYRVTEFRNSGCDKLIPRQVILEKSLTSESKSHGEAENKLLRGGWTPKEKDAFFHFAACSPVQLAFEIIGRGGKLTMAIETVVNSLESLKNVSARAFFRLINREFKKNRWDERQTPQLEGASLDIEILGENKVLSKQGIEVKEVNGDEVILDAGCLQNLVPGEYSVFETTVTEASVDLGKQSSDWLGIINVTEGHIGRVETSAFILERKEDTVTKIRYGCLAYLATPSNIRTNAWVNLAPESVPEKNIEELFKHIKNTQILNASRNPFKFVDEDLITISAEFYVTSESKKMCWVARKRGKIIVPPLGLGLEETMARNLSRYLRYKFALESAQSPKSEEELLENVSVKVWKIEKVKPFTHETKETRIKEGLKNGIDLYKAESTEYPSLLSHSFKDKEMNKLADETGDAFVFQVKNHNTKKEDSVHICVLFYQFDGAIKKIYPYKKGKTTELRGEDTIEQIFRVFIPYNSLRKMSQPDLTLPEPDKGIDTIVVYATSKPADFEALLQTSIETDPTLIARGKEEKAEPLSDLTTFCRPIKRCLEDHTDEEPFKWLVEKREFAVVKNTNDLQK